MKTNEMMRELILEVVENQLNSGDPPETGVTYKRLLSSGIPEPEVRRLVSSRKTGAWIVTPSIVARVAEPAARAVSNLNVL